MSSDIAPDPAQERTAGNRVSVGARRNPDTEAAVLDAVAAIIEEEGFARLTIEAVARRARAGKATIYRWWPSRGHLLLALYSREKATLAEPDTGDMIQDLTLYLTQMAGQWLGRAGKPPLGPLFRLLVAEAQVDDQVRRAMQDERQQRWLHIDNILIRARDRGQLNPSIPLIRAEERIISMMWYLLLTDNLPPPDGMPQLVDDITAGFAAG